MTVRRGVTLQIQSPDPPGDVAIVPSPTSGLPEADMLRAMTAALAGVEAPTASEIYNRLRRAYPVAPLSTRVGLLAALMERMRRAGH